MFHLFRLWSGALVRCFYARQDLLLENLALPLTLLLSPSNLSHESSTGIRRARPSAPNSTFWRAQAICLLRTTCRDEVVCGRCKHQIGGVMSSWVKNVAEE